VRPADLSRPRAVIARDDTKGFGASEGFETLRHLTKDKWFGLPMPFVI